MKRLYPYLMLLALAVTAGCSGIYDPSKTLYQLDGIIPKVVPHVRRDVKPVDLVEERLVCAAYSNITRGLSLLVISLAVSLLFSNPITNRVTSIAMTAGGVWALVGFIKLFAATYLVLLTWLAAGAVLIGLVYRVRKRSICRSWKWVKGLRKAKEEPPCTS